MGKRISYSVVSLGLASSLLMPTASVGAEAASSRTDYQIPGTPLDRDSWMVQLSAAHDKFMQAGQGQGRNIQIINMTAAPEVGWIRRVFNQNADGSSVSTQVEALTPQQTEGELAFEQRCIRFGSCRNRVIGTDQWVAAPRSASRIDLNLSALLPELWPVSSGVDFYSPIPDSFAYVMPGTGLGDSALVDIKYSEDVLEYRIWEGAYTQVGRIDTNARRAPVVDPMDAEAYQPPPLTRAEAENLTPPVVRRQITEDVSDEFLAGTLDGFVSQVAAVPSRIPRSRWNLGRFPDVASDWTSFTPSVCRITPQGKLVARKRGDCLVGVTFRSGNSPEFRMGKRFKVFR